MDLETLVSHSTLFFLVFARIMAIMMVAPVFSSDLVPGIARVALALVTAYIVYPSVPPLDVALLSNGLLYVFYLLGEVLIGLLLGFLILFFFSVFQMVGELFSVQMGFGASEVFDPMSQIELPILGQFYNLIATMIFISVSAFHETFFLAAKKSFESITIYTLGQTKDYIWNLTTRGLTGIFESALIMSFPILGTLILVTVTTGLLAKAAPQMNLLMLGFPISISVGFIFMLVTMPYMVEAFSRFLNSSTQQILMFLDGGTG